MLQCWACVRVGHKVFVGGGLKSTVFVTRAWINWESLGRLSWYFFRRLLRLYLGESAGAGLVVGVLLVRSMRTGIVAWGLEVPGRSRSNEVPQDGTDGAQVLFAWVPGVLVSGRCTSAVRREVRERQG